MHDVKEPDRLRDRQEAERIDRQARIQVQQDDQDVARRQHRSDQRVAEHPEVPHGRSILPRCPSISRRKYSATTVCRPTTTSSELSAPSIAASAAPGQFVMVKAGRGHDPLLRRPFSVFEVLRDGNGATIGISLLNKRIGVSTGLLYEARAGQRIDCLGPLGRPFTIVDPPVEAWMVAGGVGLAPFAALGDALRAPRRQDDAVLRRAPATGALLPRSVSRSRRRPRADDRRRQRRRARADRGAARATARGPRPGTPADALRLRPRRHARGVRPPRDRGSDGRARFRSNA